MNDSQIKEENDIDYVKSKSFSPLAVLRVRMRGHLPTREIMSISFCVQKDLGVHTRLGTGGLN